MGGPSGATNPEQLFAAGSAACFHSALKMIASKERVGTIGSEVSATVSIGSLTNGGFGLSLALDVFLPGVERPVAKALVAAAHEVCPYSNATRGNINVQLTVV